jgi:ketosteroid isomerase-like protein
MLSLVESRLGRFLDLCLVPLLVAAVFGVAVELRANDSDTPLIALEQSWNEAELRNDPMAVRLLVADDFVITQPDGSQMDKKQFLASIQDTSTHYDVLVSQDFKVRVAGQTAVVTGKYHEKGNTNGKRFDRWGYFTDTWILTNSTWRCIASHDSLAVK